MRILLGSRTGLAELHDDGHLAWALKGDVSCIVDGWAVVDGQMAVSLDDGSTMVPVSPAPQCLAVCRDTLLVGTAEARLRRVAPGARAAVTVQSFDDIPTRDEWYTPWDGPPDTRSITVTADGTPLVNVHVGGVWRGDDAGWAEVIDVECDTHQVLASSTDPSVVIAAAAVGFGSSVDGGRTFTWTTDGLPHSYCRAVAFSEDNVLVTASSGPQTRYGAVYVRPIGSTGPFVRSDHGLPEWFPFNIDTFQLAASGSDVVIGTTDGQVYVSSDSGASWDLTHELHERITCVALAG
jgi:hypothetical protein